MSMQLGLWTQATGGGLIADLSRRVTACTLTSDLHGDAELKVTVRMPRLAKAFRYYDREGAVWARVADGGAEVWRGRLEEVSVAGGALELVAYGGWVALSDELDTALWSTTQLSAWRDLNGVQLASGAPTRYEFKFGTSGFLVIAGKKGDIHSSTTFGAIGFAVPHRSTRTIQTVSFDYIFTDTEGNWQAELMDATPGNPRSANWATHSVIWGPLTTTAAQQAACIPLTTPRNGLIFKLYRSAAGLVNAQETEANSLAITNVRITTMPLAADTTLTVASLAGDTSFTVASAAGITVGAEIFIGNARRVVTSVVGTTVGINIAPGIPYGIGTTVRVQRVLASDVAAHLAVRVNALNPSQLSSAATLIAPTANDLTDYQYEDADPRGLLDALALLEGRRAYVAGGLLGFQDPDASGQYRTWYVDVSDIRVTRALSAVSSRVYAAYKEASGGALRTDPAAAASNNLPSQRRWSVIRKAVLSADTTSAALATTQAAAALADRASPTPKLDITIRRVVTVQGQRVAAWRVRAGDRLVIRNLARTAAAAIDQVAVIRVARTSLDAMTAELSIETENPPDTLEALLARLEAGV